jgi:hypothetical protein
MVRKSPDKQWNRRNSILFHETIPLNAIMNKYGAEKSHAPWLQKVPIFSLVLVLNVILIHYSSRNILGNLWRSNKNSKDVKN